MYNSSARRFRFLQFLSQCSGAKANPAEGVNHSSSSLFLQSMSAFLHGIEGPENGCARGRGSGGAVRRPHGRIDSNGIVALPLFKF